MEDILMELCAVYVILTAFALEIAIVRTEGLRNLWEDEHGKLLVVLMGACSLPLLVLLIALVYAMLGG